MAKRHSRRFGVVQKVFEKITAFFGRIPLVAKWKKQRQKRKAERVNPHKSFRRTYREDYKRDLQVPGIMAHIFATFGVIFKNWRLFLPFLVLVVVLNVLLVGLMSEDTYTRFQDVLDQTNTELAGGELGSVPKAAMLLMSSVTTGGLSSDSSEATVIFMIIVFLLIWLVTIFLLRHRLAGQKVKLRDGLYNAMAPVVPTFVVLVVALIQCLPLVILVIAYSAAVQTEFLTMPLYALAFFIFAVLMIVLSGYLLSSSLIALVAVSAPGLYPGKALAAASDLMMGRRIRFILRLVALIFALAVVWVIVMVPLILFDLFMKQFEWTAGIPFVPVCLNVMTCWTIMYVTAYLYLYYRWLLGQKGGDE